MNTAAPRTEEMVMSVRPNVIGLLWAACLMAFAFGASVEEAAAQPVLWFKDATAPAYELVQAGCGNAAIRVASRTGGSVVRVKAEQRGGQLMCVVVVLVPNSKPNLPPTTKTFVVPAN